MKHVWSIGRLLKNANILMSGTGKNTNTVYIVKSQNLKIF